jgi:hypothetical protein
MDREDLERHEAERELDEERGDARSEVATPYGVREAHRRFGGIDIAASFGGMFAGIGFLVVLAGLIGAAISGFGYQTDISGLEEEVTTAGLIAGFITLFLAFLVGGWVAGRVARYDGLLNGFMTVVFTLVLAAIFGLLGLWLEDRYNFFAEVGLPTWFTENAGSTAAIASGVGALVPMLLGALLGGWLGEGYHRRADVALASAQEGVYRRRGFFERPSFRRGVAAPGFRPADATASPQEREAYCREVCAC